MFDIGVVLLLDSLHVSPGAARCPVSYLYHEKVMLGSCLWRGYVPAGETYLGLRCSLFAPVRELAGGCS